MKPALLIIGGSSVGKKSIMSSLLGVPIDELSQSKTQAWSVDTKYYTADIEVHLRRLDEADPILARPYEAIMLVFDASDQSSLAAAQVWMKAASLEASEVRLCVANKMDLVATSLGDGLSGARDQWLEDGAQWCINEEVEYVEVSATDSAVDSALKDSEDYGLQRLLTALQSHAWPGLKLKEQKPTGASLPQPQEDAGSQENPVEGDVARSKVQAAGGVQPLRVLDPQQVAASGRDPEAQSGGAAAGKPSADSGADLFAGLHLSAGEAGGEGIFESMQDGDSAEGPGLDALLSDFSGARERLRDLPDTQRRDAAASMAMRLMSVFGLDASDEESYSSEEGG